MNRDANFRMRLVTALSPVLAALALAACGGGASTTENPATTPPPPAGYTGPPPASQDVQAFKLNVWDNLQASNRCGQCHGTGGQVPSFVRNDDINLAYEAANGVVDLGNPAGSTMVTKVSGGHNCWLANDSACGDQLTVWIRNWAGQTLGSTRGAPLQAPPIRDVGASKSFPADSALFASTVYPLLTQYCSRCHSSGATTPQSPFFAEGDVDVAYAAVRAKINLDTPAQSRLVVRLRDEFHNCWTDCAQSASIMQARDPGLLRRRAAHAGRSEPRRSRRRSRSMTAPSRAAATASTMPRSRSTNSRPARARSPTTPRASSPR